MEVSPKVASTSPADAMSTCTMNDNSGNDHAVLLPEEESGFGTRAAGPPVAACALHDMLDEQEQQYLRPILVGYAFGPKKMSTMGVVMAEASKSLSTVTMAATRVDDRPSYPTSNGTSPTADAIKRKKGLVESPVSFEQDEASQGTHTTAASSSMSSPVPVPRLTSAVLEQKNATDQNSMDSMCIAAAAADEDNVSTTADDRGEEEEEIHPHSTGGIRFSIAGGPDGSGAGGIRNIIRFFQSNCSSAASFADSSITAGTFNTAGGGGSGGGGGAGGGLLRSTSYADSATCSVSTDGASIHQIRPNRNGTRLQAVRVSFVPIDLDLPLEEQHGGKFDAILHKMTEDILYLSKSSSTDYRCASGATGSANVCDHPSMPSTSEQAKRVGRLTEYKAKHPACCLVDHPTHVQALMSRSEIARILSKCLDGVTTRSGIPASTPRFVVVKSNDLPQIQRLADTAPFTFPMIVKPLPAAGTKASHHMLVVLNRQGLRRVHFPCILQEYENHGGVLFKVYVLGDTVRVFPRNSLPNLPRGEQGSSKEHPGYVEFDSQRPYPCLDDFGLPSEKDQWQTETLESVAEHDFQRNSARPEDQAQHTDISAKRRRVTVQAGPTPNTSASPRKTTKAVRHKRNAGGHANAKLVTADEIRPIATALRRAFQLELFGFDILVTENDAFGQRTMEVVDVNYFPSYKEVSSFPSLLAQYLTQRAVEGRIRSVSSNSTS